MRSLSAYLLWASLAILHTWLFFQEEMGVNALIFSVLMIAGVTWQHNLAQEKVWRMAAVGHLLAAVGVFWHGISVAIPIYHLSAFLLPGFVYFLRSRFPVAFINGVVGTFGGGFLRWLFSVLSSSVAEGSEQKGFSHKVTRTASLYLAPVLITVLFYFLYSTANPDFQVHVSFPDWAISWYLILYTILGFMMLCPLFFSWGVKKMTKLDLGIESNVIRTRSKDKNFSKSGFLTENRQGVILFGMLNCLIFAFLAFNVLQIFIPSLSSVSRNHSEQVHQGFETLVVSIAGAIVLIMYYFRGNQNFFSGKNRLVRFAVIWIILNGLLVAFTTYKNMVYVDAYGFTYNRIFVFGAMILTGVGLYFTFNKIHQLKSNWLLFSQNCWSIFWVLTMSTLVDWDRLISWYNINCAKQLDVAYFTEVGTNKLPYLKALREQNDPRIVGHEEEIDKMLNYTLQVDKSWKSTTLDKQWLLRELSK